VIFDPGAQAEDIKQLIKEEGLKPVAIVLTHAHGDHIGAVDALREEYNIPMYMNELEKVFLHDPELNRSYYSGENITTKPADGYFPKEMLANAGLFNENSQAFLSYIKNDSFIYGE